MYLNISYSLKPSPYVYQILKIEEDCSINNVLFPNPEYIHKSHPQNP